MSLPIRSLPRTLVRSYGTVQGASPASLASRIPLTLTDATGATAPRTTWTRDEVKQIYETPLNQLTYAAVSAIVSFIWGFNSHNLGRRSPPIP